MKNVEEATNVFNSFLVNMVSNLGINIQYDLFNNNNVPEDLLQKTTFKYDGLFNAIAVKKMRKG